MRKLAEVCIERPVFATMLILSLTLVGAVSYFTLGTDRFPNVDVPFVTITTLNPGASPAEIEREISDRIEAAVNTIAGIDELRSISSEGVSSVVLSFKLEKNGDIAAQEVRQKVDLIRGELPKSAEAPVVEKLAAGSVPVLLYALSAPGRSGVDLTEIADKTVVRRLQNVSGVGNVTIYGGRKRQFQVQLDPAKLDAYRLTVADVAQALRSQNMEMPGGSLDRGEQRLTVRTLGKVEDAERIGTLTVATRDGFAVALKELARIEDRGAEATSSARVDGKPAVVINIQKQSGTNTVAVIDAVKERMEEIQPLLPRDVDVRIVRDQSEFIRFSLHAIQEHLILGGFLAALVVYVFLRNWRSTLIAAIAIPTSTISSFALMYALGYTLNLMTMLALTLMVGIVIDDAIVVLENIFRFIEQKGMSPWDAAIHGTREIGLAVMATTLSLLAVFVPIGFLGGIVGRFMSSFGFTAAAAIAVSLLVSFTLTPMLAARFLRKEDASGHGESGHFQPTGLNGWLDRHYTKMLYWATSRRWTMLALCVGVIVSTVPLAKLVGASFLPIDDESEFEVVVRAPEGTSLVAMQTLLERVGQDMHAQLAGVSSTLSIAGNSIDRASNKGSVTVRLVPPEQRKRSQSLLMEDARAIVKKLPPEITTAVQAIDPFASGDRQAQIMYVLSGPDMAKLDRYSAQVVQKLKENAKLVDVDRSLLPGKPELRVEIDRNRAADLQVRVADIATTLNTMLAGEKVTTISKGRNQYDILLRAGAEFRRDPESILSMKVPSATGELVDVRNVARLTPGTGPGSIDRLARERQVTLFANVKPGVSESEVTEEINQAIQAVNMEPGYRPVLTGNSKELARTGYYFMIATGLSFAFMYMVLAAQFESFIHPVTILLTLPLSVPFGLLSSWAASEPLNIFSALGILLLFGIVKKNAILQIDHTNELRRQGMPRDEAIILANRHRLRPILMTTIALVAGMLPLLFGTGPGAVTNFSIAVLVVGGQSLCLLLTLLAVPVFYTLFDDLGASPLWKRLWGKRQGNLRPLESVLEVK